MRWQILRAPWQQPPGSERDEFEIEASHVIAIGEHNQVIGVGRLHKLDGQRVQIRYMAVADEFQRMGVGELILKALESRAAEWQAKEIVLNARDTIKEFYLRHGYSEIAQGELLFGKIAHIRMHKILR